MHLRFFVLSALLLSSPALAQSVEALAQESETACAASAAKPATPAQVVQKVDEAARLLEREGVAAFRKFKGRSSPYIFGGTYVWIHDLDGVMKMHPIKHKMEGKRLLSLKDSKGKLFFVEMNQLVQAQGSGWVEYMWPKPNEKTVSAKVSYVKLATLPDGKKVVLGCGLYDLTKADVEKQLAP